MKKKNILTALAALLLAGTMLQACNSDDDSYDNSTGFANAVVTIKPDAGNKQMQIQLNGSTLLTPTNITSSKYGTKEVRAIAHLSNIDREKKTVFVDWIDSILTKPTAKNYSLKNDSAYGNDPVEIVKSFETCSEDGYLTLRFRTLWAGKKAHAINLVHRTDANTPYLVQLYHNANGEKSGRVGDGYVAFRLPEAFNEGTDTVTAMLQYKSFERGSKGDSIKTIQFKYLPRKK